MPEGSQQHQHLAPLTVSIAAGGSWPGERVADTFGTQDSADCICPRCGHAVQTPLHKMWTCEANQ
eukprot:6912274-Pyramimonas_sp.AAC.1